MTTAFYSRPNSTDYCHFKFKIQVSHSEKLLLRGPQNTLFIHTTWTSANNYPQQYPITRKNSPQLPNYPELPKVTQLPKNNQYHSRISIFLGILPVIPRTNLLVQGITQIALQLLVISTIRTFTQSLLLRDTIPVILTLSGDVRL